MKVFTTLSGDSIDLGSVFAISQLLFDWRSEYGVHSHESNWYVQLGIKGKEEPLKFSLWCCPAVLRTDDYDCVQKKRQKTAEEARDEYERLMVEWTQEP
jgi:hypothetical protein